MFKNRTDLSSRFLCNLVLNRVDFNLLGIHIAIIFAIGLCDRPFNKRAGDKEVGVNMEIHYR